MHVLGRDDALDGDLPTGRLGTYRARDGSDGAAVGLDFDRPHAGVVVGKRGYGKSYTLGVVAESAARTAGVAPVVVDPLGVFRGLAAGDDVPARVVEKPVVRAGALPPRAWPDLFDLSATDPTGALLWEAATHADTVDGMRAHVADASAERGPRRAAENHLDVAAAWDVFDPDGVDPASLAAGPATVLDLAGYDPGPMNAVVAVVARGLYDARLDGRLDRLPWLLVDEAHAFADGFAAAALETLLTRGRAPGVSLVAATQRPSVLPDAAISQADLLFAHRLTAVRDVDALSAARPTYLDGTIRDRLPETPGHVLVVDDATESVHDVRVRERVTPHGGESPRASEARPDACSDADKTTTDAEEKRTETDVYRA
ncbi:ATP-binding protein [Haloplanus sp. GCM10025708]|uniref:ATP-binding protein n=1 Tax=Haloferacaceae TaxID=1644056 RepID=UPI00360880BF